MMRAYHNDPAIKAKILDQLANHRLADQLVKGRYWENGKGCAVGCTLYSDNHFEYESRFGIPQSLARIEDCIFEGLPNDKAKEWPESFMSAIMPGDDLSHVCWRFLHWLLTDSAVNPGIDNPLVRDAIRKCADLMADLAKGAAWSTAESAARSAASARSAGSAAWDAAESAASAAWSAGSAARRAESAARSAESAASAARSAASAAESAASAAWSAESAAESAASAAWSAESAAWSAGSAAWSAARSAARSAASAARSAESAAESAAYVLMADKLIELLRAA